MPLYFAYGSNMDVDAMALRCPRSTAAGQARLAGHRFGLTSQGYATVVRDRRGEVYGLLWSLALSDVPALDRWEEVSRGMYAKVQMPVIRSGSTAVKALVYIAREPPPGAPAAPRSYMHGVVAAAQAARLPDAYIATLASATVPGPQRSRSLPR